MEYGVAEIKTCETQDCVQDVIGRAFLTAYLLTANTEQAENAVMEALDSWNPGEESAETLPERALATAATRIETGFAAPNPTEQDTPGAFVPTELQAVLRLPVRLRHCYVLRVLARWPREVCARLLNLDSRQVDQYTCAAMRCLPLVNGSSSGIEYRVWKGSMDWRS
jgi:hypothetical protein